MRLDLYPVIDWFVPAVLRQPPDVNQRARLFVISHFSGVPPGLFVVAYLRRIDPTAGARLWTIGLGIIAFVVDPLLLRASGWFDLLTFLSLEQFTLIVLCGAYHYGGIGSPFLPWLVAVPVLVLYHIGPRAVLRGIVFLVLGLHLVGFCAVVAAEGGFPEHVPPADVTGVDLVSLFCAAVFVAMTSLYHTELITAQRGQLEREVRVRRATEIKLLEAKEEAERANRAKSEFLAKMSHELRTPLNAIIGFSQIIASELLGPVGTARYAGYGTDIERSGHHLLQIISEILDLAKIETGEFVLHDVRVRSHCQPSRHDRPDAALGRGTRRRDAALGAGVGAAPHRRRAPRQADHAQPALERDQVYRARRHDRGDAGAAAGRGGEDHRCRHRRRHSRKRQRARAEAFRISRQRHGQQQRRHRSWPALGA